MNKLLVKYGPLVLAVLAIALVLWLIYRAGKKAGGSATVVDDSGNPVTLTAAQQSQAKAIATRIYNDINSGWLFGNNIWGNIGRDSAAYEALAAMSSTMFAATFNSYMEQYGQSMIADIRAEGSLPQDTYVKTILMKADDLNLS